VGADAKLVAQTAPSRRCRLLVHHAGTNGRQRGTSRREDALDTVIALRRPEDYSQEQGARFEVHFEKLAVPFEAKLEAISADETVGVRWLDCNLRPPVLKQAAQLFKDGLSVREVAGTLRVSKTEAGRLRLRAVADGLLVSGHGDDCVRANGHVPASWIASN
jgi:hypothetical protein